MGILSFLFGSSAKIFDKSGKVHHELGDKKWKDWENRLKGNPDYNWRSHQGKVNRPSETPSTPPPISKPQEKMKSPKA